LKHKGYKLIHGGERKKRDPDRVAPGEPDEPIVYDLVQYPCGVAAMEPTCCGQPMAEHKGGWQDGWGDYVVWESRVYHCWVCARWWRLSVKIAAEPLEGPPR
jgi:hypothetical protein